MSLAALSEEISPYQEVIAYEKIWASSKMTESKVTQLFKNGLLPSQLLNEVISSIEEHGKVEDYLQQKIGHFNVCISGDFQFPQRLMDARHPAHLFYYKGELGLTEFPSISIVGARSASPEGLRRAKKLATLLSQKGLTIISGLAEGIDTAALKGALEHGGKVIGVIGTPIDEYYPKKIFLCRMKLLTITYL